MISGLKLEIRDLITEAAYGLILEEKEKQAIQKNADEYADIISSLIKAPKGDVKKAVDSLVKNINKPEQADLAPIEGELEKVGAQVGDNLNEAGTGLAIAIASLTPKVLELTSDGLDMLKRKIPGLTSDKWKEEAQAAYDKVQAQKKKFTELKKKRDSFTKLVRMKPGPNTKPDIVKKHDEYIKANKAYHGAKDDLKDAYHEYDHKYGPKMFGVTLKDAGHALHWAYTSPILGLLWLLGWTGVWPAMRNQKKREHAANIIYALALVSIAGYGVWTHLSHAHGLGDFASIATEVADGEVSLSAGVESALEIADLMD